MVRERGSDILVKTIIKLYKKGYYISTFSGLSFMLFIFKENREWNHLFDEDNYIKQINFCKSFSEITIGKSHHFVKLLSGECLHKFIDELPNLKKEESSK